MFNENIDANGDDSTNMVVNCVAYLNNGRRLNHISIEAISDVLSEPNTFIWLGLHEPDETLLWKMQQEFGLHELAIEDAQNAHQRPKIEVYDDVLFIVLHLVQTHVWYGALAEDVSSKWARVGGAGFLSDEEKREMLGVGR